MATMQLRVLHEEFRQIVESLQREYVRGEIRGTIEVLETDEEKVEEIVDFLQEFMIDMSNEEILGFYNYDLVLDEETIPLDAEESDKRLRELVKAVMVPWESIKV